MNKAKKKKVLPADPVANEPVEEEDDFENLEISPDPAFFAEPEPSPAPLPSVAPAVAKVTNHAFHGARMARAFACC